MKMSSINEKEQKTLQLCFEKNGILYVPHIKYKNMFAYPGIPFNSVGITQTDLEEMGAKPTLKKLFTGKN